MNYLLSFFSSYLPTFTANFKVSIAFRLSWTAISQNTSMASSVIVNFIHFLIAHFDRVWHAINYSEYRFCHAVNAHKGLNSNPGLENRSLQNVNIKRKLLQRLSIQHYSVLTTTEKWKDWAKNWNPCQKTWAHQVHQLE